MADFVERRFYVAKGHTIIEKVDKKNRHRYYEVKEKKTLPITQEVHTLRSMTFFNKLAEFKPTPKRIEKKIDYVEQIEQDEYDEYEYMVTFDYETPTITSDGKTMTKGTHGKHDFKTEYRITSPVKLTDNEVKKLIQSKYSDYYNVLKNKESYEIVEEINKTNERPDLEIKQTEKIKR